MARTQKVLVALVVTGLFAAAGSAGGDAARSSDGGLPADSGRRPAGDADPGPSFIKIYHLSETYEPVTLSHKRHQGATHCSTCHHHQSEVERTPPCRECHGLPFESKTRPGLKAAYHRHCMNCHRVGGKGPLSCDGCHEKKPTPSRKEGPPREFAPHIVTLGHLSNQYTPVRFNHLVHTETADRCDQCHHHHGAVEKTPPCRECHNTRRSIPGRAKPGLEDAYHRQCLSCHRPQNGGPTACLSCHQKPNK